MGSVDTKVIPLDRKRDGARPSGDVVDELRAVLARDEVAWRRFVARYDPPLRDVVRHATEATDPLTDDRIDDVLGDFWLALVAKDMRMLRAFDPASGADLLAWLTFHVAQFVTEHVTEARAEPPLVQLDKARNVATPASDREGIIDLRRELLALLQLPDAKQAVASIVRETLESERGDQIDDGLIDAETAAELLAMTPAAVRKAASRGSLPCRRIGRKLRFLRTELLAIARR